MRGRAMAGVHGDEKARIFCQSLDAELLAIAGLYRTSETFGPEILNRGVHVFLEDEKLRVEAFA
jgi:septum site-determining protein MinC